MCVAWGTNETPPLRRREGRIELRADLLGAKKDPPCLTSKPFPPRRTGGVLPSRRMDPTRDKGDRCPTKDAAALLQGYFSSIFAEVCPEMRINEEPDLWRDYKKAGRLLQFHVPVTILRRLAAMVELPAPFDDSPVEDMATRIAQQLFDETWTLLKAQAHPATRRVWHLYLRPWLGVLTAWCQRPGKGRPPGAWHIQSLTTMISFLAGVTHVSCHTKDKAALKASRSFPAAVQRHLLGTSFLPRELDDFGALLLKWYFRDRKDLSSTRGCQYFLLSPTDHCWGSPTERRNHKGRNATHCIVHRCLEHYAGTLAALEGNAKKEAKMRKYLVSRQDPLHGIFFTPRQMEQSCTVFAYAREQLAIAVCPSRANDRQARPEGAKPRPPRVLHQWQRRRAWIQHESPEARACRLNFDFMSTEMKEERVQATPDWALLSYPAYYECKQATEAFNGKGMAGPINIFQEGNERLCVQWLAAHAKATFKMECPWVAKTYWLRVFHLLEAPPSDAARRSIMYRVRYQLRARGVGTGPVGISPPPHLAVDNSKIRRLIRNVLEKSEHAGVVKYTMDRTRITSCKRPSFHDERR